MAVTACLFLQFFSQVLFAAPGDVLFTDNFERASLGADWTVNSSGGGSAGIGTYTANSGSRSLFTRWDVVYVTGKSFDLSTVGGAQLSLWVRRGSDSFSEDPEVAGSEDLVIEYLNASSSWQELARYVGGDTPGEIFTPTLMLPADALHSGFRFRFRQAGGNGSNWDYWHIDDVILTETAAAPTLTFPFCDDFETGLTNWQVVSSGGSAGTGNQTANSASNSLYLRWDTVSVSSNDIDLSVTAVAYLNFWLRRGADSFSEDPDNNEDLTIEYFNNSGSWVSLETFNGNGSPGEILNLTYLLPADALHSAFKVRFSLARGSGSNYDYWHVDDVCVSGPPAPPSALAVYQLDETSWGTVTDSSGNGNNGSVVGSNVLPNNIAPAIVGNPGSCGYADIPFNNSRNIYDAIDTGIDVDNDVGNVGTIDFWYKSNEKWNGNNGDRQLLDASTTSFGQKYFYLTLRNNSRLSFGLEDSNDGDYTLEGGNNNFNAGVWVHLAVTWDLPNDKLQIYVNGSLDDEQTFSTNGVLGNMDTLYLGDNRSTYQTGAMTGNSANGSIDEARVYDFVLSPAQIQADRDATHPCGSVLDHFLIQHAKLGINCVTEPVAVMARQADGSTYTGYTGSIVLDTQSGNGSWTLATGNGSFADASADDGLATYTFDAADAGVAVFDLSYQSGAPSINIDAYDGAIRDDDTEGNLVFSPNGFTVTASPLAVPFMGVVNTTIPAQIAARDFQLYLAAFGQTPTDPTCGIIEEYTGAKNLKLWSSYNNPGTGTLPVKVNAVNAFASEAAADLGATQPITFTNGQAAITVNYADAGQISLSMKDDSVTAVLPTGIHGASQPITVVPAGLCVESTDLNADCAAGNETCSAFVAAGQAFNLKVRAVAWQMSGDTDFCTGNATTPNFRLANIALSQTLVAPATGVPVTLGVTAFDMLAADNGDHTVSQSISEVGVFSFTATPPLFGYFGETIAAATSTNIGRFYPDHFVTTKTDGSFPNTCTTFNYLGQSFGYLGNPTVIATAQNLSGTTTANYTGAWAKLSTAGVSLAYPSADNTQLDEGGVTPIAVTSTAGSLSRVDNADGSLTFALGGATADSFVYARDVGQVPPFVSDLTIQLTAVSDGEASASDLVTPKLITPNGNTQRFGRGYAQDVHGTMSQPGDSLTMPIGSWFFDVGGVWSLNTADSCSSYAYVKVDAGITTAPLAASPVSLANGLGSLTLSITADAGSPGGTSVVNTVWPSWLQYDLDGIDQPTPLGDGNLYDDDPSVTATFGIFRGDDRYLYWREAP